MTDELEYLKQRIPLLDYRPPRNWTARRVGTHGVRRPLSLTSGYKAFLLCQCFQESVLLSRLRPWRRPDPFYWIVPGVSRFAKALPTSSSKSLRLPIPNGWKRSLRSIHSNSIVTPKPFLISNDVGCAMPASSKNWASAMLPPSVSCATIWLPMVMASIDCSKPDLLLPRDATPSAAV